MFESEFLNAIADNIEEKFKNISIEDLKQMHEDSKQKEEKDESANLQPLKNS